MAERTPGELLDALAEEAHLFQRGMFANSPQEVLDYWRDLALRMAGTWKRHQRVEHADPAPVAESACCDALAEESMPGLVLRAESAHVELPVNLSELACWREPHHPGLHRCGSWSWTQERGSELEDGLDRVTERAVEGIFAAGHFKPGAGNPFSGMRVEEPLIVDDVPPGQPYRWGEGAQAVEANEAWVRWALHKLWPPPRRLCGAVLYGLACTYTPDHDGPHSPQITLDHFVARVEARREEAAR